MTFPEALAYHIKLAFNSTPSSEHPKTHKELGELFAEINKTQIVLEDIPF